MEYAGGYSDMLAQRKGEGLRKDPKATAGPSSKSSNGSASVTTSAQAKQKLSFKDKHALSTLPGQIAKLETEIEGLAAKLADADLFTRDRTAFDDISARLQEAQQQLESAETLWLELEEKREGMENTA